MAKYGKIWQNIIIHILTIKNIFCESYIGNRGKLHINSDFLELKKNQDDFVVLGYSDDDKKEDIIFNKVDDTLYLIYDKENNKVKINKHKEDEGIYQIIKEIDLTDKEYGFFTFYYEQEDGSLEKFNLLISDLSGKDEILFNTKKLKTKKIEIHELKCKDLSYLFSFFAFLEEVVIDKEIEVDKLESAFSNCSCLKKINFEKIKVLEKCNCTNCFFNTKIESIKTNKYFKPSNLSFMFSGCKELKDVELNFSDDYNKENINLGLMFCYCDNLKTVKGFQNFKKFDDKHILFDKLKNLDELDLSNLEGKLPCNECTINNLIISNKYIEFWDKAKIPQGCNINDIKKVTIKGLKVNGKTVTGTITDEKILKDYMCNQSFFARQVNIKLENYTYYQKHKKKCCDYNKPLPGVENFKVDFSIE